MTRSVYLFEVYGTLLLIYLFFGNSHVILNIREHSGLDEVAFVAMLCSSIQQICAFLVSTIYQRQYLAELLLVHLFPKRKSGDNKTSYNTKCYHSMTDANKQSTETDFIFVYGACVRSMSGIKTNKNEDSF